MAERRLFKEFNQYRKSPPSGSNHQIVSLYPINEDDIFHWEAVIAKPTKEDNPYYHEGQWKLDIKVSPTYPISPPTIKFASKICHPNINISDGEICLDILKKDSWSPAWNLEHLLVAILMLLDNPEPDSPLNIDLANLYRYDKVAFESLVQYTMWKYNTFYVGTAANVSMARDTSGIKNNDASSTDVGPYSKGTEQELELEEEDDDEEVVAEQVKVLADQNPVVKENTITSVPEATIPIVTPVLAQVEESEADEPKTTAQIAQETAQATHQIEELAKDVRKTLEHESDELTETKSHTPLPDPTVRGLTEESPSGASSGSRTPQKYDNVSNNYSTQSEDKLTPLKKRNESFDQLHSHTSSSSLSSKSSKPDLSSTASIESESTLHKARLKFKEKVEQVVKRTKSLKSMKKKK